MTTTPKEHELQYQFGDYYFQTAVCSCGFRQTVSAIGRDDARAEAISLIAEHTADELGLAWCDACGEYVEGVSVKVYESLSNIEPDEYEDACTNCGSRIS